MARITSSAGPVVHGVLRVVLSLVLRHAWVARHDERAPQAVGAVVEARRDCPEQALDRRFAALLRSQRCAKTCGHGGVDKAGAEACDLEVGVLFCLQDGVRAQCGFGKAIT